MIGTDETAKIYFEKSENARNNLYSFWNLTLSGVIVAFVAFSLESEARDLDLTLENLLVFTTTILITGMIILLGSTIMIQKYREYKLNYIMFYSVSYLEQHSKSYKIPISAIPETDLPIIIQTIHDNTYFSKVEIEDGLYTYCYIVTNINPNWI